MPPNLCMRDIAGRCQGRPPAAACKLYKGLVRGQAYLETSVLDEVPGLG